MLPRKQVDFTTCRRGGEEKEGGGEEKEGGGEEKGDGSFRSGGEAEQNGGCLACFAGIGTGTQTKGEKQAGGAGVGAQVGRGEKIATRRKECTLLQLWAAWP